MQEANRAVERAPKSSRAWNTKGRAELIRRDYRAAMASFSQAAKLDSNHVWAWNNLGYTELLLGKYSKAVLHLSEATRRDGATGYMFNNLGLALEHLASASEHGADLLDQARHAFEQGATRGSEKAVASRKRLERVTTIRRSPTGPGPRGKPI